MMPTTSKRLLPDDIEKLKQLRWRYVLKQGRGILFCALFLSLFVFSYNNIISYEQGVIRTTFILRGSIPIPVLAMEPKQGRTNLVAVIVHGFPGSKEHMARLGLELTKAGITSYLFDFPSYSESPAPLTHEESSQRVRRENVTVLEEVVNYAQSHHRMTKQPSILLIGYSTGSVTVSDYLEAQGAEQEIALSMLLSPTDQHVFTTKVPTDLLILTGAYDPFAPVANHIFQQVCQQPIIQKGTTMECENSINGTKIQEVVLPFLDNSMLPIAQSTSGTILAWTHGFYPQIVETTITWYDPYLLWLLLGISGAYLAMFPLCSLLINIFSIHSIPRVFWRWNAFFLGLFLLISITISLIIFFGLTSFHFIYLSITDTIVGYLFCVTVMAISLMLLTRRFLPLPLFRQTIRQLLVGILLALILYFTLGQLILLSWTSLTLTELQLWHCSILFVLLWPTYLLYEGITRSWRENRTLYTWVLGYSYKTLFLLSLLIILFFLQRIELISFLWSIVLILFLFLEGCCSQLYKSGRAAIAGATVSALVIAYVLSILFPFTSCCA